MPHIFADRVQDSTTTTGTGTFTVAAVPPIGFRTFAAVCVTNDTFFYGAAHRTLDEWEVGFGTYGAANQISRTRVYASSNAGAPVNFSAGTKDVWITDPSAFLGNARDRGKLVGFTLSNNATDSANDIDFAEGVAAADTSPFFIMERAGVMTKRIDAAWSAGSGNGGLDTGTVTDNTWYYAYVIQRPDTGAVDHLFSASATSPVMPSGYSWKRRLAAIRRGVGTNLQFRQFGHLFRLLDPIADVNVATLGTTRTNYTLTVPPNSRAYFRAVAYRVAGTVSVSIQSTFENGVTPGGPGTNLISETANQGAAGEFEMFVDGSSQISADSSAASTNLAISTLGWEDLRDTV